ncbi:uncharacterized protein LJ264_013612 isoform 1-T1 [Porphyrio hochstetteri]
MRNGTMGRPQLRTGHHALSQPATEGGWYRGVSAGCPRQDYVCSRRTPHPRFLHESWLRAWQPCESTGEAGSVGRRHTTWCVPCCLGHPYGLEAVGFALAWGMLASRLLAPDHLLSPYPRSEREYKCYSCFSLQPQCSSGGSWCAVLWSNSSSCPVLDPISHSFSLELLKSSMSRGKVSRPVSQTWGHLRALEELADVSHNTISSTILLLMLQVLLSKAIPVLQERTSAQQGGTEPVSCRAELDELGIKPAGALGTGHD